MSLILEFSVVPEDFELGRLLSLDSGTEVRVEQLVPVADKIMPFSWVSGDTEAFEEGIDDRIHHEVVVADGESRKLYRLEWDGEDDALVQAILDSDGAVLDAEGTNEAWSFRVRFREREDLSGFHERCLDDDIPVKIIRMYNPIDVSGSSRDGMTQIQANTIVDAYEEGYFEIPRETTLVSLSEKYDISDQAVSERLRRATSELVKKSLMPEADVSETQSIKKH